MQGDLASRSGFGNLYAHAARRSLKPVQPLGERHT